MAKLRWEEVYEDNEDLFYAEGYGGDGGYWLARNTREAQGNVGKWHVTLNIGGKDHGVKADGTLAFSKKGYYFDTICAAKAAAQKHRGPVVGAKVSSSKSATWKWKSKTRDRKIISYYAQSPASALEAGVNIVRWGPNEWTLQSGGAPSGHSLVIVKTGYKSAAAAKKGAVALGPWVAPPRLIPLKASRPAKPKKKKTTKKPASSSSLPSIAELNQQAAKPGIGSRIWEQAKVKMEAEEAKPKTVPSFLSKWPRPIKDAGGQRSWKIVLANGDEYRIYSWRFDGVRRWVALSTINRRVESITQPYASTHTLALKAILKRVKPLERYELEAIATIERIMKESGKTLEQLMRQAKRKL